MSKKINFSYTQLIALGFLLIVLIGTILLSLPIASESGEWTPTIDAFFTAASATCVTGLTVHNISEHFSLFGQIVILCLVQIGGIGFMTVLTMFSIFIKRQIGLYERKLLMQSAGSLKMSGIVRMIKNVVIGTLIFESAGAILLATRFCPKMGISKGIYNAIFHSVTAFCNAGFDLMGTRDGVAISMFDYKGDIVVILTLSVLIIVGGIGFLVWNDVIKHKFKIKKYELHSKVVIFTSLILITSSFILFFLFERDRAFSHLSFKDKTLAALFQSITTRTAGFASIPQTSFSEAGYILTLVLMFIGGSPGSAAGGIKVTTFMVVVLGVFSAARRDKDIKIFKRRIGDEIVKQASAIVMVYLFAIIISTMIICAIEPFSAKDVVFEVVSSIGTVGMSLGITEALSTISKIILIVLMYAGRIGGLTLVLTFAEKREYVPITLPEEKVLIG